MVNHSDGYLDGWPGGGIRLWTVIAIFAVTLLLVVISKLSEK